MNTSDDENNKMIREAALGALELSDRMTGITYWRRAWLVALTLAVILLTQEVFVLDHQMNELRNSHTADSHVSVITTHNQ